MLPSDGQTIPHVISSAMARPDTLITSSREDWLHGMLLRIREALGGSALAFLVHDPNALTQLDPRLFSPTGIYRSKLPGHEARAAEIFMHTMLPAAEVGAAIADVDQWLRMAVSDPDGFAAVMGDRSDGEDVTRYLRDAVDLREEGAFHDDGDVAPYLFCFLKGLQAVLVKAREHQHSVVHVRYIVLFRSVPIGSP